MIKSLTLIMFVSLSFSDIQPVFAIDSTLVAAKSSKHSIKISNQWDEEKYLWVADTVLALRNTLEAGLSKSTAESDLRQLSYS